METYEYMYDNYYSYENFIVTTLSRKKDSMSYVRYLYFVLYDYIT